VCAVPVKDKKGLLVALWWSGERQVSFVAGFWVAGRYFHFFCVLFIALAAMGASATGAYTQSTQDVSSSNSASEPDTQETPESELKRPTIWGEPTEVQIMIYVLDIDDVDSANQNYSASVYLDARWTIPALRHEGPGPIHRFWSEVWTPRLVIANQQQAWSAFPETVEIQPDGEVIYRQKIWGNFSQPLNLKDFPLDTQTLEVHVVAAGLLESEVKLVNL
jgi:hypothetical protein